MNLTSFFIYCVVVTFTPGPTNIVILSSVHYSGAKKTMEYVGGATIAFGLLLAASAMLNRILAEKSFVFYDHNQWLPPSPKTAWNNAA